MVTKKHDPHLKPNFREIILPASRGMRRPGVAESFVYEPTTVAEEPVGYLFFMGEIMGEMPAARPKADTPAPLRKRQDWGHLLHLIASLVKREYYASGDRDAPRALESALRKANAAVAELGRATKSPWANHLHGVIAALSRSTLHFATTGDVALYIKRGKHLVDVAATLAKTGSRAPRAFRTIASGRMIPGDTIVITSSRAAAAFSDGEHDPFVRLPAFEGITAHLTTLLRKANAGPAAVLAIELTARPEPIVANAPPPEPAGTLAPYTSLGDAPGLVAIEAPQSRFDLWTHSAQEVLRRVFRPRLIAMVLAAALILWGANQASRLFQKQPTPISHRALQEARAKRDGAENALLQGRNEQASALLTQALAALDRALRDPATQRDAEALAADVTSLQAKAERVEAVAEPPVFFDASSLAVTFAADGAVVGKNAVVFFSSTSNVLVRLDPTRAAATTIFANLDVGEGITAGAALGDAVVFLTTNGRLISYTPASDRGTTVLGAAPANARDLASFGTSLYALTADAPYLLKMPVRDGVLQPARSWLTPTEPIAAARFAIDGAIWVAESAGQLTRFYQGKLVQRVTLAGISASTVQDFETDEDHDLITIATADPSRIIIAGKDGTVIKQLASPAFANVRGLAFFDDDLLVVTPQKTYRVTLQP